LRDVRQAGVYVHEKYTNTDRTQKAYRYAPTPETGIGSATSSTRNLARLVFV
jgi:hypothetical protein